MNILSWNCRGLGRDSTVGELRWLVKQYLPSLLCLSETKMRDDTVKGFMWSLGYNACLAVSSQGRSGGLALFWRSDISVSLQSLCTCTCERGDRVNLEGNFCLWGTKN